MAQQAAVNAALVQQLTRYVQARIAHPQDAEDVVQTVLVKAVDKRSPESVQALANWLFSVARNQVIDYYRARRPRDAVLNTVAEELAEDTAGQAPELALREALGRSLRALMETLDAEDQSVLLAIDVDGEAQKAYAARKGLKYSTLKSRVQRARQRLKAALEACCALGVDRLGAPISCAPRDGGNCC